MARGAVIGQRTEGAIQLLLFLMLRYSILGEQKWRRDGFEGAHFASVAGVEDNGLESMSTWNETIEDCQMLILLRVSRDSSSTMAFSPS